MNTKNKDKKSECKWQSIHPLTTTTSTAFSFWMLVGEAGGEEGGQDEDGSDVLGETFKDDLEEGNDAPELLEEALEGFW